MKFKRIILDEELEAKKLLSSSEVLKEITFRQLFIIGKYYFSQGMTTQNVRKKMKEYCFRYNLYNEVLQNSSFEYALKKSKLYSGLKKSDYKISIKKSEFDILKKIPRKYYKLGLFILFVSKIEHYQNFNKGSSKKTRNFLVYSNYSIKEYSMNLGKPISDNEENIIVNELVRNGFMEPIIYGRGGRLTWIISCANFENKDSIFIIDGSLDFNSQVKWYCSRCGNILENKSKRHEFCDNCYREIRKEKDVKRKRKAKKIISAVKDFV
jgi:hypothetical protein